MMNAHALLQHIEARGGVASLTGQGATAKISVAPRSLARELLSDLQRFKPALLELLQADQHPPKAQEALPEVERVAVSGAATICATLQAFPFLFDALHRGQLPKGDCTAIINDESLLFEDVPGVLHAIEIDWTERARSCNATGCDLTGEESEALDRACQLLEHLSAAYSPDGWLDVEQWLEGAGEVAQERARAYKQVRQMEVTT